MVKYLAPHGRAFGEKAVHFGLKSESGLNPFSVKLDSMRALGRPLLRVLQGDPVEAISCI